MGIWLGPRKKSYDNRLTENDIETIDVHTTYELINSGNHWELLLNTDSGWAGSITLNKTVYADIFLLDPGDSGGNAALIETGVQGGKGGNGGRWARFENIRLTGQIDFGLGHQVEGGGRIIFNHTRLFVISIITPESIPPIYSVSDTSPCQEGRAGAISLVDNSTPPSDSLTGVLPWRFGQSLIFPNSYFGAPGGGGGAKAYYGSHPEDNGAEGGATGGGNGGSLNSKNGNNGTFYGAGGGGAFGAFSSADALMNTTPGSGYQGIILIRDHRG